MLSSTVYEEFFVVPEDAVAIAEHQVLNGRYGAYIACNKENFKIPKGKDPKGLTFEECKKIIAETQPSKSKSKKKK